MASPAGYAALIDSPCLNVPLPRMLLAIGEMHRIIHDAGWCILTPRHASPPTLADHLTFALKHEGLDLAALKRVSRHGLIRTCRRFSRSSREQLAHSPIQSKHPDRFPQSRRSIRAAFRYALSTSLRLSPSASI
jgi:hypothetical protein